MSAGCEEDLWDSCCCCSCCCCCCCNDSCCWASEAGDIRSVERPLLNRGCCSENWLEVKGVVVVVVGPTIGWRLSAVRMDRIVEMSEATRCSSWSSCLENKKKWKLICFDCLFYVQTNKQKTGFLSVHLKITNFNVCKTNWQMFVMQVCKCLFIYSSLQMFVHLLKFTNVLKINILFFEIFWNFGKTKKIQMTVLRI